MGWFTAVVVYLIVWWVVLFAVLPWGVRAGEAEVPGEMSGAPANPRLGLKALVTTAIATALFAVIWLVTESGWVSFRDLAGAGG